MHDPNHDNIDDIVEHFDYPINPHDTENLYKLLEVVTSENRRLDIELDELYDNRFLATATGKELEKIGDLVGVIRKTDEADSKLRKRIRGAFAAHASDTTYESFTSAALSIIEGSADSVEFATPPETPAKVIEISISGAVFEANPLTRSELVTLLNGALSADAQANILVTGNFAFDGDDDSLEGFNEGTWSSGLN